MKLATDSAELGAAISDFKAVIIDRLNQLEDRMAAGTEALKFFDDALHHYRHDLVQKTTVPNRLLLQFSQDTRLLFQHRKILECLLLRYCFEQSKFTEFNFTNIAKKAHVSKHKCKAYLQDLEQWNLIRSRTDGYRNYYRIHHICQTNLD